MLGIKIISLLQISCWFFKQSYFYKMFYITWVDKRKHLTYRLSNSYCVKCTKHGKERWSVLKFDWKFKLLMIVGLISNTNILVMLWRADLIQKLGPRSYCACIYSFNSWRVLNNINTKKTLISPAFSVDFFQLVLPQAVFVVLFLFQALFGLAFFLSL